MNGIKYYALDENEEVPYEFVVTRNVNGEPKFYASFVNTNSLAYGNGVLLKFHQRNDELRAENAKLRELVWTLANCAAGHGCDYCPINGGYGYVGERDMCESVHARMCELGIEVEQ